MSDEGQPIASAEDAAHDAIEDEGQGYSAIAETDWFLEQLIDFAEGGLEMDVILTVGGSHLAGRLVGGHRFFQVLSEGFAGGTYDESASELRQALVDVMKANAGRYPDTVASVGGGGRERPLSFVHLINAHWRSISGNTFPANGTTWRGRLAAVEGFSIGTLNPARD